MVSVIQTGRVLTLATLISERCRDLGLNQAEFVSRVGCGNIQKGIGLLQQLFDEENIRTKPVIEAISTVLDLPDNVVFRAAQVSRRLLDERERRRLELDEAARCAEEGASSTVPYLRLISS